MVESGVSNAAKVASRIPRQHVSRLGYSNPFRDHRLLQQEILKVVVERRLGPLKFNVLEIHWLIISIND